ncbi:MAG: hypothetical protein AAF597_13040 [Bacteroidota bacterium]
MKHHRLNGGDGERQIGPAQRCAEHHAPAIGMAYQMRRAFGIEKRHERACRLYRAGVPFTHVEEMIATVDLRSGVSKDRYLQTTLESMRVFRRHFFRWDRELLHWLRLGKLIIVKNLPGGLLRRLRRFKHRGE